MPSPNDVQFNPPENWDAFEAICADLFALEWDYPEAVRYGRTGQRQNGVDISSGSSGVGRSGRSAGNVLGRTI